MRLLLLILIVSVVTSSLVTAGESKIVGLSEDELISCAGFPAGQMQLNDKTFYKFASTSEGGAAFPAGGIVLFGRHQNGCEATVGVFVRLHSKLRTSPAMAAGVTNKLWEIGDIVALVEAADPKPGKRGPYKKAVV